MSQAVRALKNHDLQTSYRSLHLWPVTLPTAATRPTHQAGCAAASVSKRDTLGRCSLSACAAHRASSEASAGFSGFSDLPGAHHGGIPHRPRALDRPNDPVPKRTPHGQLRATVGPSSFLRAQAREAGRAKYRVLHNHIVSRLGAVPLRPLLSGFVLRRFLPVAPSLLSVLAVGCRREPFLASQSVGLTAGAIAMTSVHSSRSRRVGQSLVSRPIS